MNEFEAFSLLFTDSIFGNLVLYPHKEFVLFTMKELGTYSSLKAFAIGIFGFIISIFLNYVFGKILQKIFRSSIDNSKLGNYNMLVINFQKYGYIILLFNIFPIFGLLIPLLAGFVSFGIARTIVICSLSKTIYYSYYLFL